MALTSLRRRFVADVFRPCVSRFCDPGGGPHRAVDYPDDVKVARAVRLGGGALAPERLAADCVMFDRLGRAGPWLRGHLLDLS